MTTLPVIDLSAPPAGTQTLAHFAFISGWSTQLIIVNPTDAPIGGAIQAFPPRPKSNRLQDLAAPDGLFEAHDFVLVPFVIRRCRC
jgi:hypothetical protein